MGCSHSAILSSHARNRLYNLVGHSLLTKILSIPKKPSAAEELCHPFGIMLEATNMGNGVMMDQFSLVLSP
jgi:hypothetical protein